MAESAKTVRKMAENDHNSIFDIILLISTVKYIHVHSFSKNKQKNENWSFLPKSRPQGTSSMGGEGGAFLGHLDHSTIGFVHINPLKSVSHKLVIVGLVRSSLGIFLGRLAFKIKCNDRFIIYDLSGHHTPNITELARKKN